MDVNNLLNNHPPTNTVDLLAHAGVRDIDQNNWGFIDFQTGVVQYTDDAHVGIQTANDPNAVRILGTSGLGSCTGVVIITRRYAVVAHYSTGFVGQDFDNFLTHNAATLTGGVAWIMHCRDEQDVDYNTDPNDDEHLGRQLYGILTQTLGMHEDRISTMKYKPPRDPIPPNDPWGNLGEGSVMVDGRNSPAQNPVVYAQGYEQVHMGRIGR